MAKARAKASVRDRAIDIWRKEHDPAGHPTGWKVRVFKSRKRKTITVQTQVPFKTTKSITWSYEGGNLRRINA